MALTEASICSNINPIRGEPMTICIGALADNGNSCVLLTDKMITSTLAFSQEYETDNPSKIICIEKESAYAMFAGDVSFGTTVINNTIKHIEENQLFGDAIPTQVLNQYLSLRHIKAVELILRPRGLDFDTYMSNQKNMSPHIVQAVDNYFMNFKVATDIVVVHKTNDSIYHINIITDPGRCINHDAIGYIAVGSGSPIANYSLIEAKYNKSIKKDKVKKIVVKAKKRSESSVGVGKGILTLALPNGESDE